MTGLDLRQDALIEIAALVTDSDLNVLGDGVDLVIHADDDALAKMPPVVVEMHARSGLTEAVRASPVSIPEAEQRVLDYVRQFVPQSKTALLAGNSIATDRGFIARDMPALEDFLHYRMIDVSTIKELAHRALADIKESIAELAYYRRTAFVPPPGPTVEQAEQAAEQVSAAMSGRLSTGWG